MDERASLVIVAALVVGSAATLIPKVLLSLPCSTVCGDQRFDAPIFSGFVIFVASGFCLAIEAWQRNFTLVRSGQDRQPLLWRRYGALLIPGAFNVLGTLLQLAALLYIPAAVLAGLRGVFILFTAILSWVLKLSDRPTLAIEWACIATAALGAVMVGAASALQTAYAPWADGAADGAEGSPSSTISSALAGIGMSVAGYAVAACQVSYESIALDGAKLESMGLGPAFTRWEVLGVEGLFGAVVTSAVLTGLQIAHYNLGDFQGNTVDVPGHTACCLANSPVIGGMAAAYGVSSMTFNALLLALGSSVGPNFRVFVFTARGVLTWAAEVVLFYSGGNAAQYGQGLTPVSSIQAAGYILLVGGGVYRATIQVRKQATESSQGGADIDESEHSAKQPLLDKEDDMRAR